MTYEHIEDKKLRKDSNPDVRSKNELDRKHSTSSLNTECGILESSTFGLKPIVKNTFKVNGENKRKFVNKNRWSMLDLTKLNDKTSSRRLKPVTALNMQGGISSPSSGRSTCNKINDPADPILTNEEISCGKPSRKTSINRSFFSDYINASSEVNKKTSPKLSEDEETATNSVHSDLFSADKTNYIIQDTLLRKRKNSLCLERGHISTTLESLSETLKKNKQYEVTGDTKRERMNSLEKKLSTINAEINDIDQKIKSNPPKWPQDEKLMQPMRNTNIMNKLKLNTNKRKISFESGSSLSIESLASSGSYKDQSTSQFTSHSNPNDMYEMITETTLENISSNDTYGVEQLLLNDNFENQPVSGLNQNILVSNKSRSQSLNSIDETSNKNGRLKTLEDTRIIIEVKSFCI